jgi:hypothetical protein
MTCTPTRTYERDEIVSLTDVARALDMGRERLARMALRRQFPVTFPAGDEPHVRVGDVLEWIERGSPEEPAS